MATTFIGGSGEELNDFFRKIPQVHCAWIAAVVEVQKLGLLVDAGALRLVREDLAGKALGEAEVE